ncbi:MAG: VOC family protein [Nannocystaceae bacterium]
MKSAPSNESGSSEWSESSDPSGTRASEASSAEGRSGPREPSRFAWYELRTTDPAGARDFYGAVFGDGDAGARGRGADVVPALGLHASEGRVALVLGGVPVGEIVELPAAARARGAPPHWLGHVHVGDVDARVQALVGDGGLVLGPKRMIDGHAVVTLRGPCGAVMAVTSRPARAIDRGIWQDLAVADPARALAIYGDRLGWAATDVREVGPFGAYHRFAWAPGGESVGGVFSSAPHPAMHDHWLCYFPVQDLDRAIETIEARGGEVVGGPFDAEDGRRVGSFHDPQGGIFGLWSRAG